MPESRHPVTGYVVEAYPRFSETFIVSEILAREAQGERLVIFSLRPTTDARFHPELARVNAPVLHVPQPTTPVDLWGMLTPDAGPHLAELLRHTHVDAAQGVHIAAFAREHGVTHLHAHFASLPATVARLAGKIADLPYSFTAHAVDIFHESVVEEDLAEKLADAKHVITISRYNADHLAERFPESAGKIHLVRNGLELERFPFEPEREGSLTLLAVGRLVEKKGFPLLIEAVRRLRGRGVDVTAEIAGDGPLHDELEQQITAANLDGVVRLLGPITQAQVADLMGCRQVFVAPFIVGSDGNADGLPTVLLEAIARGIRVVAADVTAVGEVVHDGETGWLVPTGDVEKLAEAIAEALAPGGDQQVYRARALVEREFDARRQAARLRELVGGVAR